MVTTSLLAITSVGWMLFSTTPSAEEKAEAEAEDLCLLFVEAENLPALKLVVQMNELEKFILETEVSDLGWLRSDILQALWYPEDKDQRIFLSKTEIGQQALRVIEGLEGKNSLPWRLRQTEFQAKWLKGIPKSPESKDIEQTLDVALEETFFKPLRVKKEFLERIGDIYRGGQEEVQSQLAKH